MSLKPGIVSGMSIITAYILKNILLQPVIHQNFFTAFLFYYYITVSVPLSSKINLLLHAVKLCKEMQNQTKRHYFLTTLLHFLTG